MKSSRSNNLVSMIRKVWTSLTHSLGKCQLEHCHLHIWRWLQEAFRRWTVITISLPSTASTYNKHNLCTTKNPFKVVRACSWGTPRQHRVPKETSNGLTKEARSCRKLMKGLQNRKLTVNSVWIWIQARIPCNAYLGLTSKTHKKHQLTNISLVASQDKASSLAQTWEIRNRFLKNGQFQGRMYNSRELSLNSRSPNHLINYFLISLRRQ